MYGSVSPSLELAGPPTAKPRVPPKEGAGGSRGDTTSPRPTPDLGAPVAGEMAAKEREQKGQRGEK